MGPKKTAFMFVAVKIVQMDEKELEKELEKVLMGKENEITPTQNFWELLKSENYDSAKKILFVTMLKLNSKLREKPGELRTKLSEAIIELKATISNVSLQELIEDKDPNVFEHAISTMEKREKSNDDWVHPIQKKEREKAAKEYNKGVRKKEREKKAIEKARRSCSGISPCLANLRKLKNPFGRVRKLDTRWDNVVTLHYINTKGMMHRRKLEEWEIDFYTIFYKFIIGEWGGQDGIPSDEYFSTRNEQHDNLRKSQMWDEIGEIFKKEFDYFLEMKKFSAAYDSAKVSLIHQHSTSGRKNRFNRIIKKFNNCGEGKYSKMLKDEWASGQLEFKPTKGDPFHSF
jgi:hypothetical protein